MSFSHFWKVETSPWLLLVQLVFNGQHMSKQFGVTKKQQLLCQHQFGSTLLKRGAGTVTLNSGIEIELELNNIERI